VDDEDEEEEQEGGLDPEELTVRFEDIREQLSRLNAAYTLWSRRGKASQQI
jgi:hypothetical protein